MKRRRARRARRSPLPMLLLFAALAVLVGAGVLIARGDRTPRVAGAAAHHRRPSHVATDASAAPASASAAATTATAPPVVSAPRTPAPDLSPPASRQTPSTAGSKAPRLAIIIDDCGQWPDTERGFIALPVALTLSVLPHVRYGDTIAREAQAGGKGVMLHLPMEPRSGIDPGPGRITTGMDDDAIAKQVDDDLASVPLAAGVNNHEGSRATADDRVMRAVSSVLAQRHVFFIDSRTGSTTVAERDAGEAGVPTAGRDVFLDNVADVEATEEQLRVAEHIARSRGSAIAIGHPRPTTLAAVRALLPELQRDGIEFVLARDLVH